MKITFKPTVVTAGGLQLKPRHRLRSLESEDDAAGAATDGGDWYTYDSATGLLTISHIAHGDIVIV